MPFNHQDTSVIDTCNQFNLKHSISGSLGSGLRISNIILVVSKTNSVFFLTFADLILTSSALNGFDNFVFRRCCLRTGGL